jgi:ribosome-interacting GTPase 1
MATTESLNAEISQLSTQLADLRRQNAEPSIVEEVKKKLGELKKTVATQSGASKDSGKKKERILLKTPKVRRVQLIGPPVLKLTRAIVSVRRTGYSRLWPRRDALPRAY